MRWVMKRGPMTIAAIAEALDAKPDTVSKAV
jgi:Mn-dependent DtxR family transcriptional regulator